MRRIGKAALFCFTALSLLFTGLPVFADHIEPGPGETVTNKLGEYFPVILFALLGLCSITCAVLVIVLRKRKNRKQEDLEEE